MKPLWPFLLMLAAVAVLTFFAMLTTNPKPAYPQSARGCMAMGRAKICVACQSSQLAWADEVLRVRALVPEAGMFDVPHTSTMAFVKDGRVVALAAPKDLCVVTFNLE